MKTFIVYATSLVTDLNNDNPGRPIAAQARALLHGRFKIVQINIDKEADDCYTSIRVDSAQRLSRCQNALRGASHPLP